MWFEAWSDAAVGAIEALRVQLPTVVAAALLVLLGWLTAHLMRRWSRRLSERLLDGLGASSNTFGKAVESSGARGSTPRVVAAFVFWLVLLVFLAAAVETLGLPVMTDLLGRAVAYSPNLLAAVLLALVGLIAARFLRSTVLRAAKAAGVVQASAAATVAESVVIVLSSVMALEQLGVNGRVLELTVAVAVGSALAAVALAFGLGARGTVANLIAATYVSRVIQLGQEVELDAVRGTVVKLTATSVVLETDDGRVLVPAQRFQETNVRVGG